LLPLPDLPDNIGGYRAVAVQLTRIISGFGEGFDGAGDVDDPPPQRVPMTLKQV
jgi:hypothetical protein